MPVNFSREPRSSEVRARPSWRKWLRRGFYWVIVIPAVAFVLTAVLDEPFIAAPFALREARGTAFPDAAAAFASAAILAVIASTFAAVMAARSIPIENLARFRSAVMLRKGRHSTFIYDPWPPLCAVTLVAACILLLLRGPIDMALLSAMGISISRSPLAFLVTRLVLCTMSYVGIACLSIWMTSYLRLRQA